jgi:hypothetical protein
LLLAPFTGANLGRKIDMNMYMFVGMATSPAEKVDLIFGYVFKDSLEEAKLEAHRRLKEKYPTNRFYRSEASLVPDEEIMGHIKSKSLLQKFEFLLKFFFR